MPGHHDIMFCSWIWMSKIGYRMINKVSSTIQVGSRLDCMTNCTASPICDSCNYRPSDKTCQFNTHDTQHTLDSCVHAFSGLVLLTRRASSTHTTLNTPITLDSCVHAGSGLVLLTRRASSTLTTLHLSPTRPTLSSTTLGSGSAPPSPSSLE